MTKSRRGLPVSPDWTPEEDAKLLSLRAQTPRPTWASIAAAFPGRTETACICRNYLLGERCRSGVGREQSGRQVPWHERKAAEALAIAARDAAAQAPRTLTAMICGDPLPGRSALDQGPRAERRITLAGMEIGA